MKALVGAFNQEKALVGAFSVIVKTDCGTDGSFYSTIEEAPLQVVVPAKETNNGSDVTKNDLATAVYKLGGFLNIRLTVEKVFSDLKETYWMIGIALIGACVLSFVWIVLMR